MKFFTSLAFLAVMLLAHCLPAGVVVYSAGEVGRPGTYGNASLRNNDTVPPSVRIEFGGVSTDRSGAFQVSVAGGQAGALAACNAVSIVMRGDGGTGKFVLILRDSTGRNWIYGGKRWEDVAQISCLNDRWHKRVFYLKDFVLSGVQGAEATLLAQDVNNVQLAIGRELSAPERLQTAFDLRSIAFEEDPQEASYETVPTNAEAAPTLPDTVYLSEASAVAVAGGSGAQPPAWVHWGAEDLYRKGNASRDYVYLNNYWQFQPSTDSNLKHVVEAGGAFPAAPLQMADMVEASLYMKVPGTWNEQGRTILYDAERNAVTSYGGELLSDYAQVWIRRAVDIPESWQGRRVLLRVGSVNEVARLFVNGVAIADIESAGAVDITDYLTFGVPNDIAFFVQHLSTPVNASHADFRLFIGQGMWGDWWYRRFGGPGIIGDVVLESLPRTLTLDDLHIVTTVSQDNKIVAKAFVENNTEEARELTVRAEVLDGGNVAFSFAPQTFTAAAGTRTELSLGGHWADVRYWSPEHPQLYDLRFQICDAKGQVLDELDDSFGFRELDVADGFFFLNGKKIRPVLCSSGVASARFSYEELERIIIFLKEMHYNGILMHNSLDRRLVELCNKHGMLIVMRGSLPNLVRSGEYLPGVTNQGYPYELYLSSRYADARASYEGTIRSIIKSFRNDPAIVAWAINPLLLWDKEWKNPNMLTLERPNTEIAQASKAQEAFMRAFDPGRLIIHSMGSTHGQVAAINPYPTFSVQPDEWADWPMKWADNRVKPLFLEEVGLPYDMNYGTWFNNETNRRTYEWSDYKQAFHEHAARYFGDAAYEGANVPIRDAGFRALSETRTIDADGFETHVMSQPALQTYAYWLERVLRAWRTYDISAFGMYEGMNMFFDHRVKVNAEVEPYGNVTEPGIKFDRSNINDFSATNVTYHAMRNAFMPVVGYIGGRSERFSSQEHSYYAGEPVVKQLIFSNDAEQPAEVSYRYTVTDEAGETVETIASGTLMLANGEVLKMPVSWDAPLVDHATLFNLELQFESRGEAGTDIFSIDIHPQSVATPAGGTVLLYDEAGQTRALLDEAGVAYRSDFTAEDIALADALVIGRGSFNDAFLKKAAVWHLNERIADGLTLLVMEQTDESQLKDYLEERRSRHVFIKDDAHPVLAAVPSTMLHHWRGESDMLEAYPNTGSSVLGTGNRFQRWGTEGIVSSFVMDKPDAGRFKVLLESDFDLSRTPLLEYRIGRGAVIFNQLDLQARYNVDPVATGIANALFDYAVTRERADAHPAGFMGDSAGRALVEELGFVAQDVAAGDADAMEALPVLLVVGAIDNTEAGVARAYAEQGGTLVLLNPATALLAEVLPGVTIIEEEVRLAKSQVEGSTLVVGNSDLYFNPSIKMRTLGDAVVLKRFAVGQGVCYVFTFDPRGFSQNLSALKARRLVASLLTELGVASDIAFNFDAESNRIDLSGSAAMFAIDPLHNGNAAGWEHPDFDDSGWRTLRLSSSWESQGVLEANPTINSVPERPYDGYAWYRFEVFIPESFRGEAIYFFADRIDDLDWCYFNGELIGHTGEDVPKYWEAPRKYRIPQGLIRYGQLNQFAVKVHDLRGEGGIMGSVVVGTEDEPDKAGILYPLGSRYFYNFDPNMWRQW